MFLWFEEFYFCFLPRSLSSWQSSCIPTQILTCFCYPHADFATNCKITEYIYMSEEPLTLSLLFVGSTTAFTHEKVNTCLCSLQYVTIMQIGTLLINREESWFDVVQSSFMSPTNGQKCVICAPLCCSDETQSLFFSSFACFYLSNMKKMSRWGWPWLFEIF